MNIHSNGSGYGYTDNYFYIIFINIHGEVYGNIFLEHRYREKHNTLTNGIKFIPYDWYLELFIKPFAIQPEHCNTKCIRILNKFNQTVVNYISLFNDNLYWSPYIDKNHYSCKALCVDDNIIELYDEPKYKEYIESDKNIPKDIMDDILNDNISLIENKTFKFSNFGKYKNCSSISGINCTGMNITKYIFDFNFDKIKIILNKLDNTTKLYKLYELKIQNYIMHKLKNSRGYETGDPHTLSHIREKLTNLTTIQFYNNALDIPNLNLLDICFLQSLNMNQYNINENNTGYHPEESPSYKVKNLILTGNFLNVYENFYVQYLEIQKKQKQIKLLEENIQIDINDNKLIINTYYKEHLDLADYIPIKIKKIIKDGKLIDKKYIDINEIKIENSNIISISFDKNDVDFNSIKIIKLYNCIKFKNINDILQNKLKEFYIDDNKIEIINTRKIINKNGNIRKKY